MVGKTLNVFLKKNVILEIDTLRELNNLVIWKIFHNTIPQKLFLYPNIAKVSTSMYHNDDIISNRGLFIITVVKLMQTFMG